MTWEEMRRQFNELIKEEAELLDKKGSEYASGADALDNFKAQATDLGLDPLQVLSVLMNKHYRSIQAYIRAGGKIASNEPIEGRLSDLRNYCFLMYAFIKEKEDREKHLRNINTRIHKVEEAPSLDESF